MADKRIQINADIVTSISGMDKVIHKLEEGLSS